MPAVVKFTDKQTNSEVNCLEVDAAMCAHFRLPCHPLHWCLNWYNDFCLLLACGKTFSQLREYVNTHDEFSDMAVDLQRHLVLDFLESTYTVDSYCTVGR